MLQTKHVVLVSLVVLALVLVPVSLNRPRGIRNNNPGNIRAGSVKWKGQIGVDKDGFVIFDTLANGLRAAARILKNYKANHGVNTLQGVALLWAPAIENDSTQYAQTLADESGYMTQQSIDLEDPQTVQKVLKGIVKAENGTQIGRPWYSDAEIKTAVNAAFA